MTKAEVLLVSARARAAVMVEECIVVGGIEFEDRCTLGYSDSRRGTLF